MNPSTLYPFFYGEKPRIIGHRGAMGEAPENTLPSFKRALEDGAQFVELDVWGSKESEVVIIHDGSLGRTTNGRGRVNRHTLKELKALDAGYWFTADGGKSYPYRGQKIEIPTLKELFAELPEIRSIIEIKQARPPIVKKVVETVRHAGKEGQVLLATEKDQIMREIRSEFQIHDLPVATGLSYGEVAGFMSWLAGGKIGHFDPPGQALQIPCEYNGMTLVSEQTLEAAHELGIEMFVWTVNDTSEMARLLGLGADGIITDYPARLRDLVSQAPK
ncbi:glycerophosphodiester phosphodiesterase [bacterium]|nr:MAG: glycerophosphodiester phosphodiesterase [bacterium]